MNLRFACFATAFFFAAVAEAGPMLKDDCLKCHGPYE